MRNEWWDELYRLFDEAMEKHRACPRWRVFRRRRLRYECDLTAARATAWLDLRG